MCWKASVGADGAATPDAHIWDQIQKAVAVGLLAQGSTARCLQLSGYSLRSAPPGPKECSWCVEEASKDARYRARKARVKTESESRSAATRDDAAKRPHGIGKYSPPLVETSREIPPVMGHPRTQEPVGEDHKCAIAPQPEGNARAGDERATFPTQQGDLRLVREIHTSAPTRSKPRLVLVDEVTGLVSPRVGPRRALMVKLLRDLRDGCRQPKYMVRDFPEHSMAEIIASLDALVVEGKLEFDGERYGLPDQMGAAN